MATVLQKKNGQYLWFALLGLGFQADITTSSFAGKANVTVKHINVGPNMFDKPNKDAFYIVTHFLLEKLNPTRFHELHVIHLFTHCLCLTLDEAANAGSKVVASLFLSPGGPKFTSLMLHLTNHVMLQEMKTFTTDDSWIPEDAATPASTLDMAVKRFSLIRTRFLKTAVDQDRFLHEYQRRAQLLVKSMRDIRADGAKYDELLKYVQLLWSTIDGMLSTIKEEKNAVESVLKGDADQYILDGMDGVLRIPRCLLERIEKLPHQALGFLSPMAPLCFEPAAEASYRSSIFSQYPAKLLGEQHQILIQSTCEVMFSAFVLCYFFLFFGINSTLAPVKTKAQIIDLECDNLADQFADAIATTSPSEDSVKGSELEGLLSSLQRDPFSTRKQLPRTPESLILDVKSSWRKAVEEDNAKKIQQSADFDGSIMRRLSPLPEPCSLLLSPDAASHNVSCSVTPAVMLHGGPHADRQGALLKSSFSWDTFNAEPLDSLSGSSSVQFSLQHETLPEMPSCDSLLSLDDETVAMRSEDEELLIPLLKIESTQSPLTTRHRRASLMEKTPECLVSDYKGSDRDWLMEPATTQPTDKVFSLDLDALETHSPPKKQEYSLPKLITFSPIDDMKC
uniref:HAUS augmin-like complex subunit 6 N-terminal domain-containing protein n=1 Tax=Amphiprion ocellaris TaxID=80972 RepID=A0AAQ5YJR6_AMPOC